MSDRCSWKKRWRRSSSCPNLAFYNQQQPRECTPQESLLRRLLPPGCDFHVYHCDNMLRGLLSVHFRKPSGILDRKSHQRYSNDPRQRQRSGPLAGWKAYTCCILLARIPYIRMQCVSVEVLCMGLLRQRSDSIHL